MYNILFWVLLSASDTTESSSPDHHVGPLSILICNAARGPRRRREWRPPQTDQNLIYCRCWTTQASLGNRDSSALICWGHLWSLISPVYHQQPHQPSTNRHWLLVQYRPVKDNDHPLISVLSLTFSWSASSDSRAWLAWGLSSFQDPNSLLSPHQSIWKSYFGNFSSKRHFIITVCINDWWVSCCVMESHPSPLFWWMLALYEVVIKQTGSL